MVVVVATPSAAEATTAAEVKESGNSPQPAEIERHEPEKVQAVAKAVHVSRQRLLRGSLRQLSLELVDLLHAHVATLAHLDVLTEVDLANK